ncbi:MAG: sugar phosphate isomerase/epimerase family protein [Phycisphaerales bacterium]
MLIRDPSRRSALRTIAITSLTAAAIPALRQARAQPEGLPPNPPNSPDPRDPAPNIHTTPNPISLAQWSLHKPLFAKEIDHLDFAREARELGFDAIEYVNTFFKDKANDPAYLNQMNTRATDQGVKQLLIMCDGEGRLGDPDNNARARTVENHGKWLDAAAKLQCHAIRVNAASEGTPEEQQRLAADGLRALCERADPLNLSVLVENHGGLSSNAQWLAAVIRRVDHPRIGTLPDFGNFCTDWSRSDDPAAWYDRYKGVDELMPHARAVSAKSHNFDRQGNETNTDYHRMLAIVAKHQYTGWIGVEWEGDSLPPREGILKTKALIQRIQSPTPDKAPDPQPQPQP